MSALHCYCTLMAWLLFGMNTLTLAWYYLSHSYPVDGIAKKEATPSKFDFADNDLSWAFVDASLASRFRKPPPKGPERVPEPGHLSTAIRVLQ